MRRRAKANEDYPRAGDVISVPISPGKRCAAVSLAINPPVIVSCFTTHIFDESHGPEMSRINPSEILDMMIHGPLGFREGWRIHGPLLSFDRRQWPDLVFHQEYLNRAIKYDEGALDFKTFEVISVGNNVGGWPEDGACGHIFVEEVIKRKLTAAGFEI